MTDEVARLLFAALWLPFAAMRIHYHRHAGAKPAGLSTPEEGKLFAWIRLLVGFPWMLCLLLWLVHPAPLAWAAIPIDGALRWLGAALLAAGELLVYWTHRNLGPNFSSTLILRDDHELVERGPYRRVRHPMYSAFLVMLFGMLLLAANWVVGGAPLVLFGLTVAVRTPREERMLLQRFGDSYRAYMARTGRYLPRFRT